MNRDDLEYIILKLIVIRSIDMNRYRAILEHCNGASPRELMEKYGVRRYAIKSIIYKTSIKLSLTTRGACEVINRIAKVLDDKDIKLDIDRVNRYYICPFCGGYFEISNFISHIFNEHRSRVNNLLESVVQNIRKAR